MLLVVTGSTFANGRTSGQNQYNIIALDLVYPIGTNALFSHPVNAINIGSAFSKTYAAYGISVTGLTQKVKGNADGIIISGIETYVEGNGVGLMVTPIFQNVSGMMSGLIIGPICNKTGYMQGDLLADQPLNESPCQGRRQDIKSRFTVKRQGHEAKKISTPLCSSCRLYAGCDMGNLISLQSHACPKADSVTLVFSSLWFSSCNSPLPLNTASVRK